jgi:hypothetical protein
MKLLNTFKIIIDDISPEICWFTTFNLNVELLEKYVLTAIAGKEPSELKRAEDYEALNLDLNKYNVKVWYDHRALDLKQGKRTTVDLYAVDPSEILGSNTKEPIFHPKVIFLKGEKAAYLITGSFNLTIAGWSSNRECIVVKKITNKTNALQVIEFFAKLKPKQSDLNALNKWANGLPIREASWTFAHNYNTVNIINEIKGDELTVWSPYFSKNTNELIGEIKKLGFNKIHLIPDVSPSQKVKIVPAELQKLKDDKNIRIMIDKNINKEQQPLFHAKVWLSNDKIAIGSWNCSYRALGLKIPTNEKNIEAGVIESINPEQRAALINRLADVDLTTISGTEAVEMENEWKESLKPYSISCDITADWVSFTYQTTIDENEIGFTVALPHDVNNRYYLHELNGLSFIDGFNRLLKNKLFTIYNNNNEVVFVGYLNEVGKLKRPVEGYVSFYDLFESLTIDPLGKTPNSRTKYQHDEEEIGSEKEELPFFSYKGHESYYLMFVAFQKLLDTIEENASNKTKLEDLGYRLPSSLLNIKLLFDSSSKKAMEEKKEDDMLFHYFMAMEINQCIEWFNDYHDKPIEPINVDTFTHLLKMGSKDLSFIKKAMQIK